MSAGKHRAICNAAFPEAERRCHAEWERCDTLSKQHSGNAAAHFAEAGRCYADAARWFAAMAERIGPDTPSAVVRQARNAAWECLHAAADHIRVACKVRAGLSEKRRRARQRAEREAAGLCIQCGREPARPGRKTGEACAERARTRRDYRRRFPMPPPCGHCSARPAMGEWCALADMSRFDEPDDRFVEPEDCQRWQATAQAAGFSFEALKRCGHCGARPIADYCGETLRETRPNHFEPPPLDDGRPYAARFPGNCKRWQATARP